MNEIEYINFYKVFGRFPTEWEQENWTPMTKDNLGKVWVENKNKEKNE